MNIEYYHLSETEKSKWNKIITSCLDSLPMEELKVVQDIKVYPTLIASFIDNFDIFEDEADEVLESFVSKSVWAYSRIRVRNFGKRFISISTRLPNLGFECVPPELTIFHEIGHFQVQDRLRKEYNDDTRIDIEKQCDRYGLYCLVRLLHTNPDYHTPIKTETYKTLEKTIRESLKMNIEPNMLADDIKNVFTQIHQSLYELLQWEHLYD